AHTIYDKHYVSNSVRYLKEYKVDNIGGYLIPIVQRESLSGQLIVAVLSSRFGVGNSYFRIGSEKPRGVDTVAFGCYRREVFERIGLYNEGLRRGQDMEFNIRLKKAGGKILLHPSIVAYYYPPDTLWAFVKHSFTNGVWAIIPFKHSKTLPVSIRHIVPLGFVVSLFLFSILGFANPGWWACLFVVISLYLIISIVYTVNYVGKKKDLWLVLMPIVFMLFHISYGIGSIYGVCKCFFSASFWENIVYCLRKPKMTKSLRI
ncbi:MAG: glycosyltransferase family 2 protein, partial [Candidatus Omnitrophota bacterium]